MNYIKRCIYMSELKKCYEALDVLAASSTIRKGIDSKLSIKQQRAIAIAKATKTPAGAALARRILQLEKGEATYLAVGYPIAQSISKERFTASEGAPVEMVEDDDLLHELEEIRDRAEEIREELLSRGYKEEA
jgi:hypothetical protein